MSAFYNDVKIEINLNELVSIRAKEVLKLQMTEDDIDEVAMDARIRLTWDNLYFMVDDLILEYMDQPNPNKPNYGERSIESIDVTMEKEKKERKSLRRTLIWLSWKEGLGLLMYLSERRNENIPYLLKGTLSV